MSALTAQASNLIKPGLKAASIQSELEIAVDATPGIDPWCSGPDWTIPVADAFGLGSTQHIIESSGGYALVARYENPNGQDIIAGSEPQWGFASPIIGPDPAAIGDALATWLHFQPDWERVILPGMPSDGALLTVVAKQLMRVGTPGVTEGITRQVSDLSDGAGAWFKRRSPSFRRNLRNAQRRASAADITITQVQDHPNLLDRLIAIERNSWKGQAGDGITSPEMRDFYRQLIERLARQGRLRAAIARRDGEDIGYIFGGVRSGRYRGLQLSYVQSAAPFSISHLLQYNQIQMLSSEGVHTYDMGMDMEYKRRWADHAETSVVLILDRR